MIKMTEAESKELKEHLQAAAKILYKDTPKEQLKNFYCGCSIATGSVAVINGDA